MSFLVKGAEMPKGCITCTFKSDSMFNRTMWCEWLDDPLGDYSKCDEKWRHPDCPLVEVHAPHGRLIDVDALESLIHERISDLDHKADAFDILKIVQDMSVTIIEAEEGEA